jgi:hypothetical protein
MGVKLPGRCEKIDFAEISSEPECMPKTQRPLIRHPGSIFSRPQLLHASKSNFSHLPVPETPRQGFIRRDLFVRRDWKVSGRRSNSHVLKVSGLLPIMPCPFNACPSNVTYWGYSTPFHTPLNEKRSCAFQVLPHHLMSRVDLFHPFLSKLLELRT